MLHILNTILKDLSHTSNISLHGVMWNNSISLTKLTGRHAGGLTFPPKIHGTSTLGNHTLHDHLRKDSLYESRGCQLILFAYLLHESRRFAVLRIDGNNLD